MSLTGLSGYLSEFEPPPAAGLLATNGWLSETAVCLACVSLRLLTVGNTRPEGIDAALQRLMAAEPWPTFSVELSSTASLHVVWRNNEDESGVDLLLASADGVHRLSSFEGHLSWPGLSWDECSEIASRVPNLTHAEALIVLFPFVGDELGSTAAKVLTSALSQLGVSPDNWTNVVDVGRDTRVVVDLSKDNVIFGVRAVDTTGHRSPAAFPIPQR